MGDDACEYTDDPTRARQVGHDIGLNVKLDEEIILTELVGDEHHIVDGLHFCSAVLYADGSHVPTQSSLNKSVVSGLTGLKKATFQEIVEANTVRCNTREGYDNLIAAAMRVADLYRARGGTVEFDPAKVRNFGDVTSFGLTGQIVY
jgi:hypothetical protein